MDSMIVIVLLGCMLLLVIGGLVGHSLSQSLLANDLRRRSELARAIGEQWREIQAARQRAPWCPHCNWSDEVGPETS